MELLASIVPDVTVARRLLFATTTISPDYPNYWDTVYDFAVRGCEVSLDRKKLQPLIENLQLFSPQAFVSDRELQRELVIFSRPPDGQPLGVILISSELECSLCSSKLIVRGDRPSAVTLYTDSMGTVEAKHYAKFCSKRTCTFVQHYGYSCQGRLDGVQFDKNWHQLQYFVSSQETAFELSMLTRFDAELLIGQVSYKQMAEIYNYHHEYDSPAKKCSSLKLLKPHKSSDRLKMDRRRFELAHLKFAVLKIVEKYSDYFDCTPVPIMSDLNITLAKITPVFYSAFRTHYAAHCCRFPGCRSVLVMDGNMKNRRAVCSAKDAGQVEFVGLQGSIRTGCTETPTHKSRYCSAHSGRACKTSQDESIVEVLLAKKTTRSQTYYQVLWLGKPDTNVTWEPKESIDSKLIEAYERDTQEHLHVATKTTYGHVTTVLTTVQNQDGPPVAKKTRRERTCTHENSGVFEDDIDEQLMCQTQKDKGVRLNFRTSGILAGMRPCSIITLISELYLAESKSQVYANLHDWLRTCPQAASELQFVCYDDGCHLHKYSRNPVRKDISPTSKLISELNIVVDKMHMAGHTDSWCKKNCDPRLFKELDNIDTEVCEQTFAWLSRYKRMTTKMGQHTFMFFILYLCDLHNARETEKLRQSNFM